MDLEYRINDDCIVSEVEEVFIRSGIRRPVGDSDRIQRMIDHADENITVREGSKLVGFLRAITDYSYCCYISDIAVDNGISRIRNWQGTNQNIEGQIRRRRNSICTNFSSESRRIL